MALKDYYPREEFINDTNQFAFRYSVSEKQSSILTKYDVEQAGIKTIKMQKIRIIANFTLIQRLMQFSFNTVHDYENVITEYKAHIEIEKRMLRERQRFMYMPSSSEDVTDEEYFNRQIQT